MTVAAAEAAEPMSLERFVDEMYAAGEHVRATEMDLRVSSTSTRFTCRYQGYEFSLSFALPFDRLSERFKVHAIAMVRGLPQEWRPWRPA